MALTYDWLLEKIAMAASASSVNEIRVRLSLVTQRIDQEILRGHGPEPEMPPKRDTADIDAAFTRLEQTVKRDDIDGQVVTDIQTLMDDLQYMYHQSRWGKK